MRKIQSTTDNSVFACKQVPLPTDRGGYLSALREEIEVAKSLAHAHVIAIDQTFRIRQTYFLVMSPVGEGNLDEFLSATEELGNPDEQRQLLGNWILCLANAVAYIHRRGVVHGDIKPSKILFKGSRVLLTGIRTASFDFSDKTEGIGRRNHTIYTAAEAVDEAHPGSSADIFSLGCVFSEIYTVCRQRSRVEYYNFRAFNRIVSYHKTIAEVNEWFAGFDQPDVDFAMSAIMPMLAPEAGHRPSSQRTIHNVVAARAEALSPTTCFDCKSAAQAGDGTTNLIESNDDHHRDGRTVLPSFAELDAIGWMYRS